jgi:hypothetical protein
MNKTLKKHICCDGECNHDDCCGKVEANCTNQTLKAIEEVEREFDNKFIHYSDFGHSFNDEIKGNGDCKIKQFLTTSHTTLINGIIGDLEKYKPTQRYKHEDYCLYKKDSARDIRECDCGEIKSYNVISLAITHLEGLLEKLNKDKTTAFIDKCQRYKEPRTGGGEGSEKKTSGGEGSERKTGGGEGV